MFTVHSKLECSSAGSNEAVRRVKARTRATTIEHVDVVYGSLELSQDLLLAPYTLVKTEDIVVSGSSPPCNQFGRG